MSTFVQHDEDIYPLYFVIYHCANSFKKTPKKQKPLLLVTIYSATHLPIIFLSIVVNNFFLFVLTQSLL